MRQGLTRGTGFAATEPSGTMVNPGKARSRRPNGATAGNGGAPVHVLIVEDHTDTRDVLETLLRTEGYEVTLAAVSTLPFVALATKVFGSRIHVLFRAVQEHFALLTTRVQENLAGARVVRAYVQEEREEALFRSEPEAQEEQRDHGVLRDQHAGEEHRAHDDDSQINPWISAAVPRTAGTSRHTERSTSGTTRRSTISSALLIASPMKQIALQNNSRARDRR